MTTLDTQDKGRRQTKQKTQHSKLKRWYVPYTNPGSNLGVRNG